MITKHNMFSESFEVASLTQKLATLTSLLSLQQEFGEFVTPHDYDCPTFRRALLKRYLHTFLVNRGKPQQIKGKGIGIVFKFLVDFSNKN